VKPRAQILAQESEWLNSVKADLVVHDMSSPFLFEVKVKGKLITTFFWKIYLASLKEI